MALVIPEHVAIQRAKAKAKATNVVPIPLKGKGIRRPFTVRTPIGKRATVYIDVVHERDPKEVLLERIGPVPDRIVEFNKILVAVYQPPQVDKVGSILLTQEMTEEDKLENLWQGKVGLVVAMGPAAFQDDDTTKFHGRKIAVGEWVWFQPSNGQGCDVNEVFCRVFSAEGNLNGVIPHPDYVW